jgi:hypothetical protein
MENYEYMSFDMTQPDRVTVRLESDKMRGTYIDLYIERMRATYTTFQGEFWMEELCWIY